jgi:hypothetical protein
MMCTGSTSFVARMREVEDITARCRAK